MASWRSVSAIALFALLSVLCWAAGPQPKYDKSTEVTLKGVIEEIKTIPGPGEGIHFMLRTGDKLTLVHVAPEKFIKDMSMTFNKGDKIEVVGSKVMGTEGEEILAKSISLDANNTYTLRDSAGVPVWQGWIK
jgi:hypothetical protein